jgi:hypothetical protein
VLNNLNQAQQHADERPVRNFINTALGIGKNNTDFALIYCDQPLHAAHAQTRFAGRHLAAVVGLFHTSRLSKSRTAMLNKSSFVMASVFIRVTLPSTILALRLATIDTASGQQ